MLSRDMCLIHVTKALVGPAQLLIELGPLPKVSNVVRTLHLPCLPQGGSLANKVFHEMTQSMGQHAYSDAEAVGWALDIAQALSYLHSGRAGCGSITLHRDVKLENVLLAAPPGKSKGRLVAKLADFGLLRVSQGV